MRDHKIDLKIRPTRVADLDVLFQFQCDADAVYLAAFTPQAPTDKNAYLEKMTTILKDPSVNNQTILVDEDIVGSVAKFVMEGDAEITYWIDKKYWGRGIATKALRKMLEIETARPIFGRVAFDNFGSQRVLEKCGFVKVGSEMGYGNRSADGTFRNIRYRRYNNGL